LRNKFKVKKMKFFLLLLVLQLILIETRFTDLIVNKGPKPVKSFQKNINEMVKLFQKKLVTNELYYEDLLGFACLVLKIIKMRNQSLTPSVYWYSRKG
jgi:hypothetical protein